MPVAITWTYQWVTLMIAAWVTCPGWSQVLMWTGLLNALAVFTFAVENALFLAFPHHERAEGIAMMVRAKLTFLGKATVIAVGRPRATSPAKVGPETTARLHSGNSPAAT